MMKSVIRNIIRVFNMIMPKQKNLILFRAGFLYPDNIEAIIDELLRIDVSHRWRIVYIGSCQEKYSGNGNVKVVQSKLKSFVLYLRSKYVIFETGMYYNPRPIGSQITVNTWHGISLKKIGFYLTPEAAPYQTSTYFTAYSDFFRESITHAFGIPSEKILVTGESRNDYLFKPLDDHALAKIHEWLPQSRIIVWMPTYRHSKFEQNADGKDYELGFPFLNADNLSKINRVCRDLGAVLVLKWHGLQKLPDDLLGSLENVCFMTSEKLHEEITPMYSFLARADALITDYSSVYINYMILDRPICFAYDDLERYESNRGFMFKNVKLLMPGMHAESFEEVCAFIADVCAGKDPYRSQRILMCSQLNRYSDNHNAYRVLKEIGILDVNKVR